MTDTTDDYTPGRVLEPGTDPIDVLTVRELGIASKRLGEDPVESINAPTTKRFEALATLGWLLDRRTNPQAPIGAWLDLSGNKVMDLLGLLDDDGLDEAGRKALAAADDANPTDPSTAPE